MPIGRFERSWQLLKASAAVLRSDRELLILPVFSGAASLLLLALFAAGVFYGGTYDSLRQGSAVAGFYFLLFAFYIAQYFIIIFFNTALVGAAIERLEGGDPTIGSALALASRRLGPILGYAVVSATIGVILRAVAERLGLVGRLIEGTIGVAWTVATFLVVPVLAAEGIGPLAAIRKSAGLLRQTWGENLVGNGGIAVILGLVGGVVAVAGIGGGSFLIGLGNLAAGVPLTAVGVILTVILAILGSALTGVYSAALYCYAARGETPPGFDRGLISGAFGQKA